MKLRLVGKKNLVLTDALKDAARRNVDSLAKYFDEDTEATVVMSVSKNVHSVELTIPYKGVIFRAEAKTDDMYGTLDVAVDKIKKQLRKYKTRLEKRFNDSVKYKSIERENDNNGGEDEFKIVRNKMFVLKPMSTEEAILQMNLLGHNFFVFENADDDSSVNVVYKRNDGSYGIIETKKS